MSINIIISILVFVHIFFLIAILKKDFSVIDIGWGLGFILIALIAYTHNPVSFKNALLLVMTAMWGLRLALYLFKRNKGKPEDARYTKLRNDWQPKSNLNAYFKVFLFQGFLMIIVSLPIVGGMSQNHQKITWINWIGLTIWAIGFSFEICSDHYLNWWKSKSENRGQICTSGPWKYCRFPNYFGEVLLWYGVYLAGFEIASSWTIIGPIALNFLILKVTGVPLLEEKYQHRPGYAEYAARVPRFIPFLRPKTTLQG